VANVVYTSSVSAVGHPRGTSAPGREADFPDISAVIGHYKRSKCLAEEVARDYAKKGLRVVIVNPSTPIGPFDIKPTPTGRIVVDFLNGKMPAYMETGLNFVSVADVAEGHWLASQKGKPGERYILGNTNMMLKEFLALLAEIAGLPAPRIRIPYAIGYCIGAIDTWTSRLLKREPRVPLEAVRMARHLMFFDASRAIRELGLPQTPVRQALREAVEWFIAHGYAKNTIATRTAV
jgi:dihydroflavonol-4-reductase